MFTTEKVAQIAAFFTERDGGSINVMKLIKLMYLSDREAMAQYGEPITFDHMVSLPRGPILQQTLNLINADSVKEEVEIWERWISDRANHQVARKREFARADLNQLSDADLEILDRVWGYFGHMNQWELSDYTHDNCPEWRDPHGSSLPIEEANLLLHLGRTPPDAEAAAQRIRAERKLDQVLARL